MNMMLNDDEVLKYVIFNDYYSYMYLSRMLLQNPTFSELIIHILQQNKCLKAAKSSIPPVWMFLWLSSFSYFPHLMQWDNYRRLVLFNTN
jgi:hypothetical protein